MMLGRGVGLRGPQRRAAIKMTMKAMTPRATRPIKKERSKSSFPPRVDD